MRLLLIFFRYIIRTTWMRRENKNKSQRERTNATILKLFLKYSLKCISRRWSFIIESHGVHLSGHLELSPAETVSKFDITFLCSQPTKLILYLTLDLKVLSHFQSHEMGLLPNEIIPSSFSMEGKVNQGLMDNVSNVTITLCYNF